MKKVLQKKLIISAAGVALALIIIGYLVIQLQNPQTAQTPTSASTESDTNISYGPPTEEEKAQAEKHKDDLAKQNNTPPPPSNNNKKKPVTPIIINARQSDQQIMVSGFVSGILENDGICSTVFTRGNWKLTKTSQAFANVSTTDCQPFNINRSEFSESGEWQVTLGYSSPTSQGTSQPTTLVIQ